MLSSSYQQSSAGILAKISFNVNPMLVTSGRIGFNPALNGQTLAGGLLTGIRSVASIPTVAVDFVH